MTRRSSVKGRNRLCPSPWMPGAAPRVKPGDGHEVGKADITRFVFRDLPSIGTARSPGSAVSERSDTREPSNPPRGFQWHDSTLAGLDPGQKKVCAANLGLILSRSLTILSPRLRGATKGQSLAVRRAGMNAYAPLMSRWVSWADGTAAEPRRQDAAAGFLRVRPITGPRDGAGTGSRWPGAEK